MKLRGWLGWLLAGLVVTASCDSEEDLCDFECECEGCSERMYEDCVYSYDDLEYRAERDGCLDYYDELIDCREATAFCRSNRDFETNCGRENDRLHDCLR